ncbi:MAG: Hsp20/alpha crystallin family protein [Acidobacteriota bacterium]|jgi:HSP20 family protein
MALKNESVRELALLKQRINHMFEEMMQTETGSSEPPAYTWTPAADICEDNDNYYLEMEVPGVPIEDVELTCRENRLRVSGNRRQSDGMTRDNVQRMERFFGPFLREFSFPSDLDETRISAHLRNGVLSLVLPKRNGRTQIPVR